MSDFSLSRHIESELRYRVRRHVAEECRKLCPDSDPMVSGVTVMLGTVLAMAAFTAIVGRGRSSRGR